MSISWNFVIIERQLELEGYGYPFLRINKFSLLPFTEYRTPVEVLNHMLESGFIH